MMANMIKTTGRWINRDISLEHEKQVTPRNLIEPMKKVWVLSLQLTK